jgi:hypothetical protein
MGTVWLIGARIGGSLLCFDACFEADNNTGQKEAIIADGLVVNGSMFCREGFEAIGGIWLTGARIEGTVDFGDATLTNPNATALSADGLSVGRDMYLRNGFAANGEIRLRGARISGQLACDDGTFRNPGGTRSFLLARRSVRISYFGLENW